MKKLSYITDLANTPGGGGSYAVNWHIQEQLRRHFDLHQPAPIVPHVSQWEKMVSRIQRRLLKKPSNFFYFSPGTLDRNAEKASRYYENDVDGVFFRSATRWCHCKPSIPYFVYLDVVFQTFFENTFFRRDFFESDLVRIFESEASFLEGADAVFFESNWGLKKAKDAYSLSGDHYFVANRGGVLEPPDEDVWGGKQLTLLSVAMNFEQKGGDIILEAFKRLKSNYPGISWHIVGGRPTGDWETVAGVVYEGVLDIENREDLLRYRQLLSEAFLFVHPTREDTNPLVLTEAAYFGCPSISVNKFAIPELIVNGRTGLLLDAPVDPDDLAGAIQSLIQNKELYLQMRRAARRFSLEHFQWDQIGVSLAGFINGVFEKRG